ncbi:Catechol 2,3-dioxygenase [Variovorax sp. CF079]|uniref:VOC family protein n=1 Tax=Variovorax sp. CF079 TaxID=1882774 RepID=UPI00088689CA|nr:VOC family protein [Variovorax sp. CF079]SDE92046.1 Catechol 2,3-dioxygenase [Variovorax sp. CF079]
MPATSLFHIAIKTGRPEATRRFYAQVFGMSESPRPPFEFPGYWMQLETPHGGSIFHIYTGPAALGGDGRVPTGSGAIDHIALSAHGFAATRERCRTLGVPYRERAVPGFPLWQLFCYDPNGIQFELNFHSAHEERDGVAVDPDNGVKAGSEWFDPDAYRRFETA